MPENDSINSNGSKNVQQIAHTKRIERIVLLNITNFRGIRQLRRPLNTDADVVLITGPNGFGKTSLIDAICLLLTGFTYPERASSLLFQNEGKSVGDASIRADVRLSNGDIDKTTSIVVNLTGNSGKPAEIMGFDWPQHDRQEIMARGAFFYQDLLGRLFDEQDAQQTLSNFLAPPPPEVENARNAIKEAIKRLEIESKEILNVPGIPSESEIENQRSQAIRSFVDAWQAMNRSISVLRKLSVPKIGHDAFFVVNGDRLKVSWKVALKGHVDKCLGVLSLSNEFTIESQTGLRSIDLTPLLDALDHIVQHIKTNLAANLENKHQLRLLVDSLAEDDSVIDSQVVIVERKRLETIQQEIKLLKVDLDEIESLIRYFQSSDGISLGDILAVLRSQGSTWLKMPAETYEKYGFPVIVHDWLQQVMTGFFVQKEGIDQYFDNWLEQTVEKRKEIKNLVTDKENEYRVLFRNLEILQKINDLADKSPEIKLLVDEARIGNAGLVTKKLLLMALINDGGSNDLKMVVNDPLQSLKLVQDATNNWRLVEEKSRNREDVLRRTKSLDKAREQLNSTKEALLKESLKRSSIIEGVLSLGDDEMKRLCDLINGTFMLFRTVDGLYPVKLKKDKKGARGQKAKATWSLFTQDGRSLDLLSTGQKAQLGLSLLLSLNLALDKLMPHCIVALDDTTTALDMAQLPRESILLRQLVYGNKSNSEGYVAPQRQLFIVSHHEDLTNRLVDFLMPPEGKTMHILDFIDWSPENGPEIEQYKVESTSATSDESRSRLSRLLASVNNDV